MAIDINRAIMNALGSFQQEYSLRVDIVSHGGVHFARLVGDSEGASLARAVEIRVAAAKAAAALGREGQLNVELTTDLTDALSRVTASLEVIVNALAPSAVDRLELVPTKKNQVDVRVIPKNDAVFRRHITPETLAEVVEGALHPADVSVGKIDVFFGDTEEPSSAEILRAIKVCSPATAEEISVRLRDQGTQPPEGNWIKNQLDALRRQGLIAYIGNERHALTASGLSAIPGLPGRGSSDIERLLRIARRNW